MFKTLTDYNDLKNTQLYKTNIWEAISKFIEEESIVYVNNVTLDTFSNTPSTKIENANNIFTSEKIDKSDKLVDTIWKLTINDAKYYESNIATASDAQGNLTKNT